MATPYEVYLSPERAAFMRVFDNRLHKPTMDPRRPGQVRMDFRDSGVRCSVCSIILCFCCFGAGDIPTCEGDGRVKAGEINDDDIKF